MDYQKLCFEDSGMPKDVFLLKYAGHPIRYSFLVPGTRYLFRPAPRRVKGETVDVVGSWELLEAARGNFEEGTKDEYLEYRCLLGLVSRYLLRFGCCVFHAAAFRWRDRAWLLTAPPETGKTTQYVNWQRLFPGEIAMISGDMPVLEGKEDGSVWVYPSSWNGKENLFGAEAAPLGGVVLLEQGSGDQIEPLSVREGLMPLMQQFMVYPETEEEILSLTKLMERVFLYAPCWKFVNRGRDEATRLLRETLLASCEMGRDY